MNIMLSLFKDVTLLTFLRQVLFTFISLSGNSSFAPSFMPSVSKLVESFYKIVCNTQSDRQIQCWTKVPNVTLQEAGTRGKSSCHRCQLVLHPGRRGLGVLQALNRKVALPKPCSWKKEEKEVLLPQTTFISKWEFCEVHQHLYRPLLSLH